MSRKRIGVVGLVTFLLLGLCSSSIFGSSRAGASLAEERRNRPENICYRQCKEQY